MINEGRVSSGKLRLGEEEKEKSSQIRGEAEYNNETSGNAAELFISQQARIGEHSTAQRSKD